MDKQLDTRIRDSYTEAEFIHPDLDYWEFLLRHVTHRAEWTKELPDGEFSVYRGGTPTGFSWTLSENIAKFFATRFKAIGRLDDIYSMLVTKKDILWYTNDREEQEVVLFPDPKRVKKHA